MDERDCREASYRCELPRNSLPILEPLQICFSRPSVTLCCRCSIRNSVDGVIPSFRANCAYFASALRFLRSKGSANLSPLARLADFSE